ncbi:MAG: hypothetical protein ACHP8B_18120, partial [Terriglobales bacterium]
MKYQLEYSHKQHLCALGVPNPPEHVHAEPDEYAEAFAHWQRTLPDASHEELHTKTLGHLAWKRYA